MSLSLISLNGVEVRAPSSFKPSQQDFSKSTRNARAKMISEFIARKAKLELAWSYLTAAEWQVILNAIEPFFFPVTYLDQQTNALVTKTFYKGDRNSSLFLFNGGIASYKDCAFNIIEQ